MSVLLLASFASLDRADSLVLSVWALAAVVIPFVAIAWVHTYFPNKSASFAGDLGFWAGFALPKIAELKAVHVPLPNIEEVEGVARVAEAEARARIDNVVSSMPPWAASAWNATAAAAAARARASMPTIHESVESTSVKLQDYAQETRAAFGRRAKKAKAKAASAFQALQAREGGGGCAGTAGSVGSGVGAGTGCAVASVCSAADLKEAIPATSTSASASSSSAAAHNATTPGPGGVYPTPPDSPASGATTPKSRSSAGPSPDAGPSPGLMLPRAVGLVAGGHAGEAVPSSGRSVADIGEQLDRIEAAVLSLADAFGGLQRQVATMQRQAEAAATQDPAALPATAAAKPDDEGRPRSPCASTSSVAASWDDESFSEPTSEA